MKKISLCVPTYNRPDSVKLLIKTYKNQTYQNKELVISDDSTTDDVMIVVKESHDSSIKYFRNSPSLGFPKNLLASLMRASGDYKITIGDDDLIISNNLFKRYVDAFQANPRVGFMFCNQIQFNNQFLTECSFNVFPQDIVFPSGKEAITKLLIYSVFIGGQGFRGDIDFKELYPTKDILHPQVQLVGSVLSNMDGMGLSEYGIGAHSHDDQIIFRALKNKSIQREGKHMTIELLEIFDNLKNKYSWEFDNKFLVDQLIRTYPPVMIKEKIILGNEAMLSYYTAFRHKSLYASKSIKLFILNLMIRSLPSSVLITLRSLLISAVQVLNYRRFQKFNNILKQIFLSQG